MNLYGFVFNSPGMFIDDNGRNPILIVPLVICGALSGCSSADSEKANAQKVEYVQDCVIKVFAGHGLLGAPDADPNVKITDAHKLRVVDVPINIKCGPNAAATVIACSAKRFVNIDDKSVIPDTSLPPGAVELWLAPKGERFCELVEGAIEAAKAHAKTLCNKTPKCCTKVKIEGWMLGTAKSEKRCSDILPNGYKGWVVDCATGEVREGDN